MARKPLEDFLVHSSEFSLSLGRFHTAWANIDVYIDISIGQFLKIADEEAHLVTAAMEFGRKATLLRALIARSSHKNRDTLIKCLNTLQNESNRNVFAHSYLGDTADDKRVVFIERSPHGKFKVRKHEYTIENFQAHVEMIVDTHNRYRGALDLPDGRLQEFAIAAVSLDSKS